MLYNACYFTVNFDEKGANVKCIESLERIMSCQIFISQKSSKWTINFFSASIVPLFTYYQFLTVLKKKIILKQRSEHPSFTTFRFLDYLSCIWQHF